MLRFWAKVTVSIFLVLLCLSTLQGYSQTPPPDTSISQSTNLEQQIDSLRSSIQKVKDEAYDKALAGINRTVTLMTLLIGLFAAFGAYLVVRSRSIEKEVKGELEKVDVSKTKLEEKIERGMERTEAVLTRILESEAEIDKKKKEIDELLAQARLKKASLDKEVEELIEKASVKQEEIEIGILKQAEEIPSKEVADAISVYEDLNRRVFGGKLFYSMAYNYFKANMFEEALIEIKKYAKSAVLDVEAYKLWASILSHLNRHDEAVEKIKAASELYPREPRVYLLWATILGAKRDYQGSVNQVTTSLDIKPDQPFAYFIRSCARAMMGDKKNAFSDLMEAVSRDENLKVRARGNVLLKSLWDDPEFKKLVN